MKVTAEMLREGFGCERQVVMFEKEWPLGMVVKESNLKRAINLDLDIQAGGCCVFRGNAKTRFLDDTRKRWRAVEKTWTLGRFRNYLRSIIPDILKAAQEMDDVRLGSVEAKAKGKK